MQIRNPNFKIDPILKDERGFNSDLGVRGKIKILSILMLLFIIYIITIELVQHFKQIQRYLIPTSLKPTYQKSRTLGLEAVIDINWTNLFEKKTKYKFSSFLNFAHNNAKYISSDEPAFYR